MTRLSISHKLMLAFLGLTLIVLVATLGLARWSFERGFLDYVNAQEQVRLTRISEDVGRLYIESNRQWQNIDTNDLQTSLGQRHRVGANFESRDSKFRPPPPHLRPPPNRREGLPRRRPPPIGGPRNNFPPTALFDLQGVKIAGHVLNALTESAISVPVIVDTQTVAVLTSEPIRDVGSSIETAFSRQQWVTSLVIGIGSLLLAALVSWGLTRLLLSPVHRMIQGVNRLSKGDYSQPLVKTYHDEFGLLVEDINYLSTTLEKNRSSRNRWLADISHELRTPLAILTGEVEALKDGIRPFGPEQLVSLDQEIQRLRYLVDDLYQLSLSDIGGLRYEFAGVDLTASVKQSIKSQQLAAEEKDITVAFDESSSVMISGDEKRISQLLANLIRNSLAYTNASGRVEVSLQVVDTYAVLKVNDTLPSVAEVDCNRIFEPLFRQDESRSRRSAGAGLGLAICRNIVEAHRGTIHAAPSSLGGLQMTIGLPLLKDRGGA